MSVGCNIMPDVDSAYAASTFVARFRNLCGVAGVVLILWALWLPVLAATGQVVVVKNDRGGGVIERARLIKKYEADGTRVEIRGNYCLSACTMYIGLQNACVAPQTVFGFHGPSSQVYGISLNQNAFDFWSRVMAEHYPEPLKSWFLNKGRNRTVGFYEYSGADLINMGVARCSG